MYIIYAKCLSCGETHYYGFGKGTVNRIGDLVDSEHGTYHESFFEKCRTCGKTLYFFMLIEKGLLVNVLLNPSSEQTEQVNKGIFKKLRNYPKNKPYTHEVRQSLLLGEDDSVVPEQFSLKEKYNIKDIVTVFGTRWIVLESYKSVGISNNTYERIYKVISADEHETERLLILADDRLPVLREVSWDSPYWPTDEEKLRKYKLRPGFEIVMDLREEA